MSKGLGNRFSDVFCDVFLLSDGRLSLGVDRFFDSSYVGGHVAAPSWGASLVGPQNSDGRRGLAGLFLGTFWKA